jgi:C1A family cysteine protease
MILLRGSSELLSGFLSLIQRGMETILILPPVMQSNFHGRAVSVVCLCFLAGCLLFGCFVHPVFAEEDMPALAPLNPDFIEWQNSLSLESAQRAAAGPAYTLGYIPPPYDWSLLQLHPPVSLIRLGAPASYDLRTLNGATPVRDQGSCGSCWTFGTYGSLESWIKKREMELDFSENHLKNYHGFDWGPCSGGNEDMSLAYLTRWSGPVSEADDPYRDYDDRPSPGGPPRKYVENVWRFSNATDIKTAIMTYGALSTMMYLDGAYYNSGTYTYYYSGSNTINHAVTVVGWNDNKVVPGAPGNGAWIIKNSYGTSFGENGYFYISYYDSKAVKQAVAFIDAVPVADYSVVYQYDPLGLSSSVGYGSETAWAANIFTPSQNGYLGAIGTIFLSNNTSYEIRVYDTFSSGQFSSQLGSAVSGTATYAGYYTIQLPAVIPLASGNSFGVVVKYTTPGNTHPLPVESPLQGYSSGASASAGQSYISSNGTTFSDITTYFSNSNVNIKALTVPLVTVPRVPTAVVVAAGNGQATVYFTAPVWDGGSPVTLYTVTAYPGGITATGYSSPITVTGLTNGVSYTFTVTATNIAGTGPASVLSSSVIPNLVMRVQGSTVVGAYSSIQTAYTQCVDGDIIELQATTFPESPDFNANVPVLLKGGFDPAFGYQTGMTIIQGTMTISSGTVTVENVTIH